MDIQPVSMRNIRNDTPKATKLVRGTEIEKKSFVRVSEKT